MVSPGQLGPLAQRSYRGGSNRRVPLGVVMACLVLVLIVLAAIWPGLFASHPDDVNVIDSLQSPSAQHIFGTDELGRDVFARVVYGTRTSLLIALGAVFFGVIIGTAWGMVAALSGRIIGEVASRATEVLLSIPAIFMAILVVAVLGTGALNTTIAFAVVSAPAFALIVRGQVLAIRSSEYIKAATVLGVSRSRIIRYHVLPNTLRPVVVFATLGLAGVLLGASALSFVGLGAQPPTPEWGLMLSESLNYLQVDWTLGVFPGLAIFVTVMSFSVLGRFLQARLDRRPGS